LRPVVPMTKSYISFIQSDASPRKPTVGAKASKGCAFCRDDYFPAMQRSQSMEETSPRTNSGEDMNV